MKSRIDYYLALNSPWTYLGSRRFAALAKRYDAEVRVMPVALGQVFEQSGGVPLAKRPIQRQAYRLVELQRWREYLEMPLNLHPKFFPANENLAARLVIALREQGGDALTLAHAIMRAVWAEERNIADPADLRAIMAENGLDADGLFAAAETDAVKAQYERDTEQAIAAQVFGAPSYVYDGRIFWGQDRLDFLERALSRRGGSQAGVSA